MGAIKKSTGSVKYYNTLQRVFKLQQKFLTGALPHAGERGTNDEERCRDFLGRVLPSRFSIGSGFIVSSARGSKPSPQQDIIIYDGFLNSPLFRELSAGVFPIEMVYATVEVKGRLNSKGLDNALKSIGKVRHLARECFYEFPPLREPGRFQLHKLPSIKRPPRAFIFAYGAEYDTMEGLRKALENKLNKPTYGAHLHGLVVLSKNWFAFQRPYVTPAKVEIFHGNALLRFVNNMLMSLKSVIVARRR